MVSKKYRAANLIYSNSFSYNRRIRDLDYHEKTHENQFIPETYFSSLYLQSGFVGDTDVKSKVEGFVLPKPIEPYVPGKKLFVSFTNRSLLTKRQHSQCLAALKCLRSGKEPGKYTAPEKANIEIYKVIKINHFNVLLLKLFFF